MPVEVVEQEIFMSNRLRHIYYRLSQSSFFFSIQLLNSFYENMDPKKLSGVIMIVAIIVDVLWGFLGNDWGRSWIAVFVGVMLSVIVNIIFKDGSKK